ncbi:MULTISPECIES: DUF3267 domain-containing protein [Oceanobacillus]|uniref:DUF3267 domain-containing protein n=1 Tax=Oceanobacillus kimchii TaxID=746691 RepID=A0ABQ5THU1_9BACI|nr:MULTISPECIES: DUF3267 domain-containing protein [Oceanobacillus]MBT2599148.1 DUF3267 domain-containing protein [Oceanobacillus sp. ISL-74]MBT2652066.1 DUF3267 domain-containing protein [Oceanobacillus sp. ISL-73]MCT1578652.1 DUF3267 domain-containing protein [Oceanobacillus kimchii]MCT2136299.1 DUF3267 domain-containing protein [Oceanobacillus kimchii]OEH54290.1 hypothetical protein AQ616_11050 [Oceanobacillus sp. E9]
MNCLKTIYLTREFGKVRLQIIALFISLLVFIISYVPLSFVHGAYQNSEKAIFPFIIAIISMPILHSLVMVLSLSILKKTTKIPFKFTGLKFPAWFCFKGVQLTKVEAFVTGIMPTIILTLPGFLISSQLADYYLYTLLWSSIHLGMTVTNFIYLYYILKSPKKVYIQHLSEGFELLLKQE